MAVNASGNGQSCILSDCAHVCNEQVYTSLSVSDAKGIVKPGEETEMSSCIQNQNTTLLNKVYEICTSKSSVVIFIDQ